MMRLPLMVGVEVSRARAVGHDGGNRRHLARISHQLRSLPPPSRGAKGATW